MRKLINPDIICGNAACYYVNRGKFEIPLSDFVEYAKQIDNKLIAQDSDYIVGITAPDIYNALNSFAPLCKVNMIFQIDSGYDVKVIIPESGKDKFLEYVNAYICSATPKKLIALCQEFLGKDKVKYQQ